MKTARKAERPEAINGSPHKAQPKIKDTLKNKGNV
jgi:hypothetical protein